MNRQVQTSPHTHTQVQPVIDVPAKTNASTGQVVSPPAEGGVVKTTPTQEAPPTTSAVNEDQVPSQNTTGADRPQTAAPKSRQTSLDGLLGSWTSATAGWFKKVSAEYVKEGEEGGANVALIIHGRMQPSGKGGKVEFYLKVIFCDVRQNYDMYVYISLSPVHSLSIVIFVCIHVC